MARLSIGAAWEETLVFVKREGTLLFPVALVFLALPAVVLQLFLPDRMRHMATMEEVNAAPDLPPSFLLAMFGVILIGLLGTLAIYALSLRPGISVAEALQLALRRMPVLIGAGLLLMLGFSMLILIFSIIGDGLVAVTGTSASVSILILIGVPIAMFAIVRLLLLNAVVLDQPVNSIEAIRHSWRLTIGQFWKLAGFLIGLIVLMLVSQLVSRMIFGIAGSLIGGSTLAALLAGLAVAVVNAVLQVYYLIMTCRIYRQLRG
ncbi:MAG: hypothetical protein JJE34_09995 [Alphaproteobacteria bacterium]|nr:hypothetical protein [Alphaproteobacteria bacterium]